MKVLDVEMYNKLRRALKCGSDLYSLDDIGEGLASGTMQGHVEGKTWAITQVHTYPQRKLVHILFVIGDLDDALKLEQKIVEWAKEQGASMVTSIGRRGWWKYGTEGWKIAGTLYSKEI